MQGSRRVWHTGLALVACLGLDALRPVSAEDVDATALALVEQRNLGEGLAWLGYQAASRTAAFAAMVKSVGRIEAQTLVQNELRYLQPDYQSQWDRNLAASYAHSFTAEELRSLDQGESSLSLANSFRVRNARVIADMKARSSELLKQFVARALGNAQMTLQH
ncbi:Uncharacterized protein ALO57_03654 [Pseudomonas coronafaciens pv. oryzae]|uniref:hypothetical protein n=1 Tax=Pseudomonas coronafaciens TaxID=53409 RepID=UPI0006B620B9|nr:hypothetical protein [Pseudomonas coronafaciens]KPB54318.1 Uncharacterized protein AC511_3028 [Pseudomonas coronafaciens pv. oryzae]KPY07837.1 Uncharacterized protein ALO57_03654 [Pseudomonas coronafaciens pv. oryzae]RMS98834.1 hypothetical protein ALP55_02592 [Pseudomonas coronafaciens pv. oryzae]